jgi:hypothetical protein
MNIKTRKLLRTLVRQNPELASNPQALLDMHHGKVLHVPVFLIDEPVVEEKQEEVVTEEKQLDINSMDWNSMLELAKTNNITNYRKMKKSELTSALLELQNDGKLLYIN